MVTLGYQRLFNSFEQLTRFHCCIRRVASFTPSLGVSWNGGTPKIGFSLTNHPFGGTTFMEPIWDTPTRPDHAASLGIPRAAIQQTHQVLDMFEFCPMWSSNTCCVNCQRVYIRYVSVKCYTVHVYSSKHIHCNNMWICIYIYIYIYIL